MSLFDIPLLCTTCKLACIFLSEWWCLLMFRPADEWILESRSCVPTWMFLEAESWGLLRAEAIHRPGRSIFWTRSSTYLDQCLASHFHIHSWSPMPGRLRKPVYLSMLPYSCRTILLSSNEVITSMTAAMMVYDWKQLKTDWFCSRCLHVQNNSHCFLSLRPLTSVCCSLRSMVGRWPGIYMETYIVCTAMDDDGMEQDPYRCNWCSVVLAWARYILGCVGQDYWCDVTGTTASV